MTSIADVLSGAAQMAADDAGEVAPGRQCMAGVVASAPAVLQEPGLSIPAVASVRAAWLTGERVNGEPLMVVALFVEACDGRSGYDAELRRPSSYFAGRSLRRGTLLPVRIDRARPDVVWEEGHPPV